MTNVCLILAGVFSNACAQILLKYGMNRVDRLTLDMTGLAAAAPKIISSPYIWGGLCCYVFSFVVWLVVLSRVDISLAYPMISLGYIIGLAAGHWLFNEPVSTMRVLGTFVILVGVIMISQSSESERVSFTHNKTESQKHP